MNILFLLGAIIILAPIPFGSVHETSYTLWSIVIAGGCFYIWLHPRKPISPSITRLMWCIGSISIAGFLSPLISYLFAPAFPLNDIHDILVDPAKFWLTQWMLILAILLAFLTSQLSSSQRYHVISFGIFSGLLVSTIALAQWLSDNGKLLWMFEPTYISESTRARWPFVNPNHLGAFLLIPFFLCLSRFSSLVRRIQKEIELTRFRSHTSVASQLVTIKEFPRTVAYGLLLSWIGITIIATQSRAVFITVIALSILVTLSGLTSKGEKNRRIALWALGALALVGAFVLFDQRELIKVRLQYGLLAAKDDIRWEMYKESLPLISPLGVGFGGWERRFLSTASPDFVGLNPEYLHSDPLQFLVEGGLLSAFIIVFFLSSTIKRLFTDLFNTSLGFLSAGILGVLVASLFDFPFRIPAVSWVFIIFLVTWLAESENLRKSQSS